MVKNLDNLKDTKPPSPDPKAPLEEEEYRESI